MFFGFFFFFGILQLQRNTETFLLMNEISLGSKINRFKHSESISFCVCFSFVITEFPYLSYVGHIKVTASKGMTPALMLYSNSIFIFNYLFLSFTLENEDALESS